MNLKTTLIIMMAFFTLVACEKKQNQLPLVGTWELVSAVTTEKDTSFSTFNPKLRMIKIINQTHFAFLSHDLAMGKDTANAAFTAGGGMYTLEDSTYTEHLTYYIDRQWENNDFNFTVKIANDTLTQKGVEKVEELGIDRVITEKYVRVKN